MKRLNATVAFVFLLAFHVGAIEHSAFARVTVYWPGEGSGKSAAWNGARLSEHHCAVDPKKIPYGSKVLFGDGECVAVDTGPDVVKRKAARSLGQTSAQRNAIVVDRFFETKEKALGWARAHADFMIVRIHTPEKTATQLSCAGDTSDVLPGIQSKSSAKLPINISGGNIIQAPASRGGTLPLQSAARSRSWVRSW